MSALAVQTGSMNLGQGFPDDDGPAEVLEAAQIAIASGLNQYPPGLGIPALRTAIAEHQNRFYGVDIDPDAEVLVTAGATEALAAAILAFASPGDEVLTFEPYYDAYAGLIALAGATHRTVPLVPPNFQPDPEQIRERFSDATRIVLVNSPHNPTGAVFPAETLQLIVDLAEKHDALIVTDEVYEHLTFDRRHVPVSTLPGAAERTITISSGGKTFSTTGWKVGWAIARNDLLQAIVAVKQFLTYVNAGPFQPAIATGLGLPDTYFSDVADSLRRRRDMLSDGLRGVGFEVYPSESGYFVVADAAPLGVTDAAEFCRALPKTAGVVGVPVTAFCSEFRESYASLVRFAFCKSEATIREALLRLRAWTDSEPSVQ